MQLKLILISIFISGAACSNAQFQKGYKMTGSSIAVTNISSGQTEYSFPSGTEGYTAHHNNFNISLNPSIGWFIQNNLVAGVQLITNFSKQEQWLEAVNGNTYKKDNYRNLDFGAGGFLRYYFSITSKFKPFAHAYLNAGSGSTKTDGFYYLSNYSQTYTGNSSDRFFYNAGLNAGVTKMINASVGLEAFAGYVHSSNKFTTTTKANTNDNGTIINSEYQPTQKFSGNGLNVGVGLQVFLSR